MEKKRPHVVFHKLPKKNTKIGERHEPIDLFNRHVYPCPNTGCHFFAGSCTEYGYGSFHFFTKEGDRKTTTAHRFSYMHYKGEIPDGMFVCHTCDVPACVNPDHLYLGTPQDNMDDKVERNRQTKGVDCKLSKITEIDVVEIRQKLKEGILSKTEIGRQHGIKYGAVRFIELGKNWGWVK